MTPRVFEHVVDAGDHRLSATVWDFESDAVADVVLAHGGAAHRGWWSAVAPLLRGARRVVAFDFSGHGDSDWHPPYSLDLWAGDLVAVASALLRPNPVLVGHSMGGQVALHCAQQHADVRGVLLLDSPLRRDDPDVVKRRERIAARPNPTWSSLEDAIASYRTYPASPAMPDDLRALIATQAFVRREEGWVQKFDPLMYDRPQVPEDFVRAANVPTRWIRAQDGLIDDEMAAAIASGLGPSGWVVPVADVGHNLLLEQPRATAWLASAFLAEVTRDDALAGRRGR